MSPWKKKKEPLKKGVARKQLRKGQRCLEKEVSLVKSNIHICNPKRQIHMQMLVSNSSTGARAVHFVERVKNREGAR
jgi:hypothetical protein